MPSTAAAIGLPFDEAIDFFKQKTRIPTKGWTDVWRTASWSPAPPPTRC